MDKTGLGTASTRTNIIRTLLERKYIRYSGKYIIPTPKGLLLYETVRGMKVADASLTSGWEAELARIEQGELTQKEFLDGRMISYVTMEYYMLNKPSGVLTATMDKNAKTVLDLMNVKRKDLFPVGRLDKDTEGLLLITNDGELAHNLLAPKKHVDKTYYARAAGRIREEAIKLFADGLHVDEGKFHQIKRMFEAVGSEVLYLKRLRMGSLVLDETLKPGEYRTLTQKEIDELYNCN